MISWQVGAFVILGAVLVGGFAWYERSKPPSQVVALVAALAALAVAGRVVVAPIPNVVATTDVAIFSGYALGGPPGFVVGALAGLISNFWLGQGPWTPWQMAGWGLAGVFGALLARSTGARAGRLELALACGLAGIAYGALLNFSLMVSYGGELTLDRFLALQARAVPFDVAHAAGNIALALVAGPAMVRMLIRFSQRFEFEWAPGATARGPGRRVAGVVGAAGLLLVTAALAGATARTEPALAASGPAGVEWLRGAQSSDGGFAAEPGEPSSTEMTGWAMLGLEAAGVNPAEVRSGGRSALGYLRAHLGDLRSPGDLARTILALRGAGADPRAFAGRDLTARLAARRRRDGSYQGWPNSTAFAVMALRASGLSAGIGQSLAWLRRVQNRDGGWGAVPGASGDPDSTGAVLQALAGRSPATKRGVHFLRKAQGASGGWPLTPGGSPNSQSTAWAIQGLLAAGVDPSAVNRHGRSGLDYLTARRAGDGHYRYSSSSDQTPVWVTGQVLAAVELQTFPIPQVPRTAPADTGRRGSRKGGAAAPPERLAHERGGAKRRSRDRPSSELRVREGSGAAPNSGQRVEAGKVAQVRETVEPGADGEGGDDGDSPLIPVAIGLGAAGLVLGATWLLGRRFVW